MALTKNSSRLKTQSGSSLIEAAIVMPVIIACVCGILQWGLIFGYQIVVGHAAAVASRVISSEPNSYTDTDIETAARNAATPLISGTSLTVTVTPFTQGGISLKRITCTYNLSLMMSFVVPGQVGGVLTLTGNATAQPAA